MSAGPDLLARFLAGEDVDPGALRAEVTIVARVASLALTTVQALAVAHDGLVDLHGPILGDEYTRGVRDGMWIGHARAAQSLGHLSNALLVACASEGEDK